MIYAKYARNLLFLFLCGFVVLYYLFLSRPRFADPWSTSQGTIKHSNPEYIWAQYVPKYTVRAPISIPTAIPGSIPAVQHRFAREGAAARSIRTARLEAVKGNFTHAWTGYKNHAWMSDEVAPISGRANNPFGGWAATLVDSLDTLWIMGLYDEFEEAVAAITELDFTQCSLEEINVFETTIRYLGGFLGAYDVSQHKYPILLAKAIEVGQMLYAAFDTPNRMPITRWKINATAQKTTPSPPQEAGESVLVAEIGSLTLEFTRLGQLSQDDRYYDAIQRIMDVFDAQQEWTKIPDGQTPLPQLQTEPRAQYLSCFAGGMVALGAKVFGQPDDLDVAQQLVDGCIWGYENGHLGIMPEVMHMAGCEEGQTPCSWNEERWHQEIEKSFPDSTSSVDATISARNLPRGVSKIDDGRYNLRPEAVESIFILYRITGDPQLVETAWTMFNAIIKHTTTEIGHAGLNDCTVDHPPKQDRMKSFWLAETLKYFYLMFAEPDVVSLDEYVLNTEAHPFRRSA